MRKSKEGSDYTAAAEEAGTELATTTADFARQRPNKKAFYSNGQWQSKPPMTLSIQIGMGIEVSIKQW